MDGKLIPKDAADGNLSLSNTAGSGIMRKIGYVFMNDTFGWGYRLHVCY